MIEQPEGIIKTMPLAWVKELPRGLKAWEKLFMSMNDREDDYHWIFNLSGKPRYEVLYFYLLIDGFVRYRCNIIDYTGEETVKCYSGEYKHGKVWVHVAAPVVKTEEPIKMKGFQGFRYTSKLF